MGKRKVPVKPRNAGSLEKSQWNWGHVVIAWTVVFLSWLALQLNDQSNTKTSPTATFPVREGTNSADLATDFIFVVDDALTSEFCDGLVSKFQNDPRKLVGRAGVKNAEIKKSMDLPLTQAKEYQEEVRVIQAAANKALAKYAHMHPHLLFGAVAPDVLDPETRQMVPLEDSLWGKGVGQSNDRRARDNTLSLLLRIYRHGHLNMQHYKKDEGHYSKFHSEHMPHWEEDGPIHRVLLWMVYLNDVTEGGSTDFYYQNRSIMPKKGRLVIAPASFTHTHRGEMPRSDDKFIATSWLMWKNVKQLGWDRFASNGN